MRANDLPAGLLQRKVIIDRQWCMIRKAFVFVDAGGFCPRRKPGRDHLIVKAPPNVFGPGLTSITPPGILLSALI